MSTAARGRKKVLLSTLSSDAHTWNLVFLQLLLEEHGYEVINLGPCVPDELILSTARTQQPDIIVISSVNGHGSLDGARLIRALRMDPSIPRIPTLIGGKLGIGGDEGIVDALIEAGFDAVFTGSAGGRTLTDYLHKLPAGPFVPQMLEAPQRGAA